MKFIGKGTGKHGKSWEVRETQHGFILSMLRSGAVWAKKHVSKTEEGRKLIPVYIRQFLEDSLDYDYRNLRGLGGPP